MGRAPCCDKANVKRGPWSPEEDVKLKSYIEQNGTGGNWISLPQKIGLKRCGKSCRLRWLNYLRPNLKHGGFSEEEDNIICSLYISIGSRWSIIAAQLPGRTDNDIKNYWNTRLKKKLLGKQRKDHQQGRRVKTEPKANIENGVCEDGSRSMYWPGPSAPTYQISQDVDGQASIKKLLIKLGGRFSDEHGVGGHRSPFPIGPRMLPPQPLYEDPANLMSNIQASTTNGSFMDCLQGSTEFPMEFEEIFPCSSMKIDGLDCMYGDGSKPSTSESANWNEVGPLIYPPLVTGYHEMQQCLFEDPVNVGMQ